MKIDYKYLTFIQYLLKNIFDLSQAAQIVKFLPNINPLTNKFQGLRHVKLNPQDTHLLSQIGYIIYPANTTNKANIYLSFIEYILITCNVLLIELYAMSYVFDIKKRHWERYQIMQKILHQYKHYKMGGKDKHEISKYEKGKDRTSKY